MKKKRIALIGSGELSKHIAHYVKEDNQYDVVGYFDDFTTPGSVIHNYPVIGTLNDILKAYKDSHFDELINGIGFTRMKYRKEVFCRFENSVPFASFLHSRSFVDKTAQIGKGVILFPFSMVYFNAVIEDNVFVQVGSIITDSIIKRHSMISASVTIAGRSTIGECCNIGVSTTIINDIEICDHVQTGGGCVITKKITEPGVYVGVPAKKIKSEW